MLTIKSVNHVNPLFNKLTCLFRDYFGNFTKALTCNKFVKSGSLFFLMINK